METVYEGDWSCTGCGRHYSADDLAEYGLTCGMDDCDTAESK
jgi:hypothetical protein